MNSLHNVVNSGTSGLLIPLDFGFMNANFQCSLVNSIKEVAQMSKDLQYANEQTQTLL